MGKMKIRTVFPSLIVEAFLLVDMEPPAAWSKKVKTSLPMKTLVIRVGRMSVYWPVRVCRARRPRRA